MLNAKQVAGLQDRFSDEAIIRYGPGGSKDLESRE